MGLNRSVRILLVADGIILLAAAMIGPIYAMYVEEIGGDLLDASITFGLFSLAAAVTAFIAGFLSDEIRETKIILAFGYFAVSIGFLGYLLVDSVTTLFIVQIVVGIGHAIHTPALDALLSKHARNAQGKAWGAWEAINYLAAAAGAMIGGLVVTQWSFSVLFLIMSLLSLFAAVYIFLLPRRIL